MILLVLLFGGKNSIKYKVESIKIDDLRLIIEGLKTKDYKIVRLVNNKSFNLLDKFLIEMNKAGKL